MILNNRRSSAWRPGIVGGTGMLWSTHALFHHGFVLLRLRAARQFLEVRRIDDDQGNRF